MNTNTLVVLAFFYLPILAAEDLYVSTKGSDAADGKSPSTSFATFDRVEKAVRDSRSAHPDQSVTVWIDGGTYALQKPIALSKEDSGTATAPVIYRPVEEQKAVFTNSRKLQSSDFFEITDPVVTSRISPEARGKLMVLNLKALGLHHLTPPPHIFSGTGEMPDLYFNGQRMTLSRYPKEGKPNMTIKTVLLNGSSKTPGTFEYRPEDYSQFEKWSRVVDRGIWLKGYWRVMWDNPALKVATIDTAAHTVTFSEGLSTGIGSKYHRPGGDGKEAYWVLNQLEEITQPGEWCIDYAAEKLYFYPPSPLNLGEIYLTDSDLPLLSLTDVSHVTVRGLTFQYCFNDAVIISGGTDDLIAGCTIRNVDKYGIRINGGRHHTVLSCDLYHLGSGGVWLSGGEDTSALRVASGHRVLNNHIHHFSEIERVYTPAVNCGYAGGNAHFACVGNLVAHNLIHDTPHGGVLFGSWDNIFEYNEIFRYCLVSNDLGAFYSFSQYAYMGNETFRYNLIHGSGEGDGIYFDWDHRDMHIYGNVIDLDSHGSKGAGYLYKNGTQTDPKFPENAQPLDIHDNIAVQCRVGYTFHVPEGLPSTIQNNVAVNCQSPWSYQLIRDKKEKAIPDPPIEDTNKDYPADPGFVDMAHLNFKLKPNAQLLTDLPTFQQMPLDKVGLYLDEFRTSLPTDDEIDRYSLHTSIGGKAYNIEDRK